MSCRRSGHCQMRIMLGLRNMFNAEVNKQIQAEKTNYLRGTTPRTSNTKPISKYDKYKSTGNVQGMISEKLREYRDEDDY